MKNKKMLKKVIPIVLIVGILIASIVTILLNRKNSTFEMTPQLSRAQDYESAGEEEDKWVNDTDGNRIEAINFNAFFVIDRNGDGIADPIRGTCNEVGADANLFMELSVIEEGKIKNAKIEINSDNFYFNTSIVKDKEIAENYLSSNTKEIKLNEISNGSQKLLSGSVRSGDYSSSSTKTSAIGNDIDKYSSDKNIIVFSGEYEASDGTTKNFRKEIPLTIDWYGEVNAEITPKNQSVEVSDMNSLVENNEVTLDFDIIVEENRNQLIMSGSYISGTIPELNGYKATSVTVSGTNVTSTYDEETGTFTAQREAVVNENGQVTSNAYSSYYTSTRRRNTYDFTVTYPAEAYYALGENISSFELAIPVEAVNKGFNNPNTDDGFQNPYVSNTATGIVVTTWRKPVQAVYSADFDITVGRYMGSPYYDYVVSKEKPINIYNGTSLEETDDLYIVDWEAYTGTNGETAGIEMEEGQGNTGSNDDFLHTNGSHISMNDLTANKGIYFSGATNTLGEDGWIRVYNDETQELIETFTSENWSSYSSSNPYIYENSVKHIRVVTSETNASSYFHVYNIKELDDTYITENYTREEFDNLTYIYSYLDGYMTAKDPSLTRAQKPTYYEENTYDRALYEAPTSVANISIKENTISTQATAENEIITIKTETSGYNEQGWVNGAFLVKLPAEIISAEVNSVTIDNGNVAVSAYDVYEENGSFYIKILTENAAEESYSIEIDCNLTPDPRIPRQTKNLELWAINEIACDYYYPGSDSNDLDGDLNTGEQINYRTTSLTLDPGSSLNTTQEASNYDTENNITIAPRVAKVDKAQRTATVSVSAINNYSNDITDIKIQGVVPFEGNDYVISGNDMGSQFTTHMQNTGISAVTAGIGDHMTVYYSVNENPTNDTELASNGWTLAENVQDWSQIKTYLIAIDKDYQLSQGNTLEFEYEISIPEGRDYNQIAYSAHAIYFAIDTGETGLYYTSTGSEKLGFMIAKQYDLEIVKHQEDKEKTIQGVTFAIQEDGQETSTIKVTGAEGIAEFTGLYAERHYTLKEIKTTDDYVLNTEEIHFYTYTEMNDDGTESLYLVYDNGDGTYSSLSDHYESITEETVFPPDAENQKDYRIQLKIANEVKAKLKINKVDGATNTALKNVKFTITGEGKNGQILTTDAEGNASVSGLYLDQEYTLEEIRATGYYIPENTIKFTITNNNGSFELNYTDNGTTTNREIITEDEIPTISLNLQNEKISTYGLQLTKYAKDEKVADGDGMTDRKLEGAQYKITGEGINGDGAIYTTDSNGVLTIDGLYEYVNGKYITGEYTLTEIYAPEGYTLNATSLKFKAYRENGTLKIEVLEGEDVIRVITNEETQEESQDVNIRDDSSTYPVIEIGVEDGPIFSLFKYEQDGTTSEKKPIAGTKFKITDLNGNYVTGTDGKIIGKWEGEDEEPPVAPPAPTITLSSEGTYKWTQREDGTWESTGNHNIHSSESTLTSNEFTLSEDGVLSFDWAVSSESANYDYVYYTITNIETGKTIGGTSTKIGGTSMGTNYDSLKFENITEDLEAGTYKIEFVYKKDSSSNSGLDAAFVRNMKIEGAGQIDYDQYNGAYLVTTDENGQLSANLPEGLYKAVEVSTPDQYVLPENEADRTYYFGIGASQAAQWGWINGTNTEGTGWEYINSIVTPETGGIVGVGSFSKYSTDVNANTVDGIDLNKDGTVDKVSEGGDDGLIVGYDSDGNYTWAKSFGGADDDALTKVVQTTDGGYAAVGYVSSTTVKYDGNVVAALSKTGKEANLAHKDAVIIKLDSSGNYEWGVRFGGLADEEIMSVIQTSTQDLVVVGKYYSETFNFYNTGSSTVADSFTNPGKMSGFVASYSSSGQYKWSQSIGGSYDDEATAITETTAGIVVAADGMGTVYFDTAQTASVAAASTTYTSGFLVGYTLDGAYSWNYKLYPSSSSYNIEISALTTNDNDHIVAAVEYSYALSGSKDGGTATTIVSSNPTNSVYDAALLDFSNDGTYNEIIYTVAGNYDDYIADVKMASDGGILLGGWYYSDSGIDVDGDGATNGIFDFDDVEGSYTSDGFLVKLNADYQVEASTRYYGDGYDGVLGVGETPNGSYVTAGFFSSSTLNALSNKVKAQSGSETTLSTNVKGNFDGFIAVEGIAAAEVPSLQNIEIKNEVKTFKVTTEVRKHLEDDVEVAGGDIDGEEGTFNGVTYSKDGIRYVETVKYAEDSTKEIKITPDPGYTIAAIEINGQEYTDFTTDENGVVTLPIFENMLEDKHIVVEFSNTKATVEVNHYLWTEESGTTTEKVADSESYIDDVGKTYTTSPKTDIEYVVITNEDYYGEGNVPEGLVATDYYVPDNSAGTYVSGHKEIVNYYYKEKTYTLTVHHYLVGTETPVPLKGADDGSTVPDEFTEGYKKGTSYETTQASEDKIDYDIYELVGTPENAKGTIEEDTVVTYYYDIKKGNITITKVAEEDHDVTLGGTEFTLYKAKTAGNNDLIDTDESGDNWEVVGTYTTPDTGLLRLQNLPITSEYRLVETKASDGRLLADGQWKIEFVYGQYDENDETITDVNGTKVRITAIGNPPAIAIAEDGSLDLPNREIYQIPSSGGLGIDTIYQVGLVIALLGATIFVGRKFLLAKGMNLSSKGKRHARRSRRKGKH